MNAMGSEKETYCLPKTIVFEGEIMKYNGYFGFYANEDKSKILQLKDYLKLIRQNCENETER